MSIATRRCGTHHNGWVSIDTQLPGERIVDIDVGEEMRGSFLEYAYSVIYSRALPDARDGLKPVQRRILFQMAQMGLRPDRGHVKSARVVGEVMGRLHPHGDSAIYDALVRMAQPFSLRLPLIDGHGNFGSLDDGPAAMRYTECRLAPAADSLIASLHENTVDYVSNYDGRELEPTVLPAAVPVLLVNGAAGIAVGMATNMPPHNLAEVCSAAKLLLRKPSASLKELMRLVPGPDLPTGCQLIGIDGIKEAYATGKGAFQMRATTRIESLSARRQGIVVTELPAGVGPERVIERIKDLVVNKKVDGISAITDLTDGEHGLQLVIEVKNGFSPEAVRERLYRLTPLQESFNINNVALVDGQPKTLGLIQLLQVFLDHRVEIITRRSAFRLDKARDRLHLVDGLLIATLNIDEVVALIRSSDDASAARERLMAVFDLSEIQATHILDMPLRRLTKYSRIELETEQGQLQSTIEGLERILGNREVLEDLLAQELDDAIAAYGNARRSVILHGDHPVAAATAVVELEVQDEPCHVALTATGQIARVSGDSSFPKVAVSQSIGTTTRGEIAVITSAGRAHRVPVVELPEARADIKHPGAPVSEYCSLDKGELPVALMQVTNPDPSLTPALGTAMGVVKRLAPDAPTGKDIWDVIKLRPTDRVVGACDVADTDDLVFITTAAQLLRFPAASVRPQGRSAAGVAGIKLPADAQSVFFGRVTTDAANPIVVTVAGTSGQLAGTGSSSVKVSSFSEFPAKGRATGGVRCQKFTKGEDALVMAWAGPSPARAETAAGRNVELPSQLRARDASGEKLTKAIVHLGSLLSG